MENSERRPGFFARLLRGLSHPVTTFIFGVMLPAASVAVEMSTGICSEAFGGDLTGNVFQCAAMCAVPVVNFIVWLCCLKGWGVGSKFLRAMCGFSFGISIVYAFAFLPLSAFGAIFFCLAFWYFGFGFIGLLPSGPLFATLATMGFRRSLDRQAGLDGGQKVKGFAWGLALAGLAWLAVFAEMCIEVHGMRLAASDDPASSAKGVRMLRTMRVWTDDAMLWKKLRNRGRADWFALWHRLGRTSLWRSVGSSTTA